MRTRWFDRPLDTVAMVWRIDRADGVSLGFTGHDRDLMLDLFRYRAAPGLVPSAIELGSGLDPLDMEIAGALDHRGIAASDLAAGRFDGAGLKIGLADWSDPAAGIEWLVAGELGRVTRQGRRFRAELQGGKARLDAALAPVTTPACRARFCGPGCGLSPAGFEHEASLASIGADGLVFAGVDAALAERLRHGELRWIDGANAGLAATIIDVRDGALRVDPAGPAVPQTGDRALLSEGCDHEFETCVTRFGNAINFRGEPYLPGNDLLTRQPGI